MDFGFSPEQEMLRESTRKLLVDACPPSVVRAMMGDATAHAPTLWRALAELGVLGILVPAEHGGQDGSFLDLAVVLEEAGKALLPGPFFATVVLGGVAVACAGSPAQQASLLPGVATGDRLLTVGLGDPEVDGGVAVRARREDGGVRLQGALPFVMDAHVADTLVVAARPDDAAHAIAWFAVGARQPGVAIEALRTVDMTRRLCRVALDVRVPETDRLEASDGAATLARVLQHAEAAIALEAVGTGQRALDLAVAYANERVQFGRPIGSFQAVKHKCVDMMVAVETARSLAYYAAWAVAEDAPDVARAVAMAKAYATDVARTVTSEAIQVHGGIGFTWEHDLHLYHRRALALGAAFASAARHRETVARGMVS